MTSSLAKALAPVAVQWAQCENANCQKWRRLPANAVVDEDAPWYCYMNPDPQHNTCSASEAEYDEEAEFVIPTDQDLQEAQEAEAVKQNIAKSIHANIGKGGRRKMEGKSQSGSHKQQTSGRTAATELARAPVPGASAAPDARDSGDDGEGLPPRMNWRQLSKHLVRLLDAVGGGAEAPGTNPVLPPELWRELGLRCPEAAELVREAADSASAARCFAPSGQVHGETTALTQAALALAAGLVLAGGADALPDEERRRLGFDAFNDGANGSGFDAAALRERLARLAA